MDGRKSGKFGFVLLFGGVVWIIWVFLNLGKSGWGSWEVFGAVSLLEGEVLMIDK